MKKTIIVILVIVILLSSYLAKDYLYQKFFEPTETVVQTGEIKEEAKPEEVLVTGLNIPWELVFLPEGDMLVTERSGRLLRIENGKDGEKKIIEINGVTHRGEGGLLGLTLHPNFAQNNFIYVYMTTTSSSGLTNRVERYTLRDTTLSDRKVIIENIPGASNHDGGRIAFGPDGFLYITTGDAGNEESAQDKNSLAGKILRVSEEGSVPEDNPFKNEVYSYGHRNIQGIAWDNSDGLWATEHGRSGAQSGFDEVNKIIKGGNYGWPDFEGDELSSNTIAPVIHSGSSETWAPAGALIFNNSLLFTGLRGEALYSANISNDKLINLKSYFRKTYGRLRTIVEGPDNMLYLLTNNKDGRGRPGSNDDRIIRIDPSSLGL